MAGLFSFDVADVMTASNVTLNIMCYVNKKYVNTTQSLYLKSSIHQAFVIQLFEHPPDALHE